MNNITITAICLAIFSACSVIGGIILIILEVLDQKKEKPPVWFHSMDIREEVEKGEDE